jgi:hypothetical protein
MGDKQLARKIESDKETPRPKGSLEIIAGWLRIFDRLPYPQSQNRKPLAEEDYAIYAGALADLPAEVIDAACREWSKVGKYFPLPADIRSMCRKADSMVEDLEGERAWQRALELAGMHGNDYPIASAEQDADEAIANGMRAAGGARWIAVCTGEQLVWAKKTFLEIWRKWKDAPGQAMLPSTPEGRELLAEIARVAEAKKIPA